MAACARAMIARLIGTLLLALLPAAAAAGGGHHEHGGDAPPLGTAGAVTVQGYQVELLTHPSPLVPDRSAHLVAKVFRSSDLAPVPAGRVLVGFAAAGAGPADEDDEMARAVGGATPRHRSATAARTAMTARSAGHQ